MTYKDKIKQTEPEMLDDKCAGGVAGCPGDYFCGAPQSYETCIMPDVETSKKCTLCWNRMYKGEFVYD